MTKLAKVYNMSSIISLGFGKLLIPLKILILGYPSWLLNAINNDDYGKICNAFLEDADGG